MSSSGRRSAGRQSHSIAATSSSSPGHLPTTAASRARGNGNGGGARFEDFADSTVVTNADDTFGAAIKGKQRASQAGEDEQSIDEFAAAAATSASAQPAASAAASSSSNTRRPRKTFNEVADDSGFVFTVEPRRDAPAASMGPPKIPASRSKATAPPPSTSRSKFISEPLPSDQVGETPINRRNRLFRGGGPNLPSTPASRRTMSGSSSSARRSSLNFKTSRRSSSLRDGSIAYPHPSVPDKELYRHCADNMPPVARMKHLAGWTLERARAEVLEATPAASASSKRPTAPKGKRAAAAAKGGEGEDSAWSAQEKKVLERCRPSLEKVMLDTLRDLSDQKINISWLAAAATGKGASSSSTPQPRPNPLNESNQALAEQLSSLVAALRSENARWEEERKEIEAFEEATASMLGAGSAAAGGVAGAPRDVTSSSTAGAAASSSSSSAGKLAELDWTTEELDPATARMMQDARRALALEEKWLPPAAGASSNNDAAAAATDTVATAVRAAAATKRKAYEDHLTLQRKGKRKSDMVPPASDLDGDDETAVAGTDLDPRWRDVEYHADVLHSHTHIADRLSLLSSSYTSSISARAAQALRQLAFAPGDATEAAAAGAGASSSSAEQQRGGGAGGGENAESRKAGRERLEKILRGVRESIGPVRRQEIQDEDAEAKALEEAAAAEAAAVEGGVRGGRGAGADDSGVQLADQSAVDLFRAFASTKRSAPAAVGAGAAGGSKGRKSARSSRR